MDPCRAATDGRKAVAYYDFTFAPPKSVSVYYAALLAAGKFEAAAQVARAHDRARRAVRPKTVVIETNRVSRRVAHDRNRQGSETGVS